MPTLDTPHSLGRHLLTTSPEDIKGYTLTELIATTAIIAILAAIGFPSYQYITSSYRIAYEANDLRSYIELARSEALKQGLTVILCPSTNGSSCSVSNNWAGGWIIASSVGDCTSAINTPIKIRDTFVANDTATFNPANAGNNKICFTRMGLLAPAYSGWFSFNTAAANSGLNRCISLSSVGQAKIVRNGEAVSTTVNCS